MFASFSVGALHRLSKWVSFGGAPPIAGLYDWNQHAATPFGDGDDAAPRFTGDLLEKTRLARIEFMKGRYSG
jgi:hypothetical protein